MRVVLVVRWIYLALTVVNVYNSMMNFVNRVVCIFIRSLAQGRTTYKYSWTLITRNHVTRKVDNSILELLRFLCACALNIFRSGIHNPGPVQSTEKTHAIYDVSNIAYDAYFSRPAAACNIGLVMLLPNVVQTWNSADVRKNKAMMIVNISSNGKSYNKGCTYA